MSRITPESVDSQSVRHLKNLAKRRKKETGCTSSEAHEFIAKAHGFKNWNNVLRFAKNHDTRRLSSSHSEIPMEERMSIQFRKESELEQALKQLFQEPQTLESVHHRLAERFQTTLSNALRRHLSFQVKSTATVSYSALQEQVQDFAAYSMIQLPPTSWSGCVVLESSLIFQLLQIFFGGADESNTLANRSQFTDIEYRMIKRVIESFLEDMELVGNPDFSLSPEYLNTESNATRWLKSLNTEEPIIGVVFEVQLQQDTARHSWTLYYQAQPQKIENYLIEQHPQTIALILTHAVDAQNAIAATHGLPKEVLADVLYRVATLGEVPPGIIQELKDVVVGNLEILEHPPTPETSGYERATEILRSLDPPRRQSVEHSWKQVPTYDPQFVEKLLNLERS